MQDSGNILRLTILLFSIICFYKKQILINTIMNIELFYVTLRAASCDQYKGRGYVLLDDYCFTHQALEILVPRTFFYDVASPSILWFITYNPFDPIVMEAALVHYWLYSTKVIDGKGKSITIDQCKYVLSMGFQRLRTAAALELALCEANEPLFEVRALGARCAVPRPNSAGPGASPTASSEAALCGS